LQITKNRHGSDLHPVWVKLCVEKCGGFLLTEAQPKNALVTHPTPQTMEMNASN
jgi:hypothetical protein